MSEEPQDPLIDLIREARRVTVLVRKVATPLLAEHDLTIAGRSVLDLLVETGPLTAPAIAAELLMTRQVTQRQLDDLVRAGHAERAPNQRHRRSHLYRATTGGTDALRQARRAESDLLSRLPLRLDSTHASECREALSQLANALAVEASGPR